MQESAWYFERESLDLHDGGIAVSFNVEGQPRRELARRVRLSDLDFVVGIRSLNRPHAA